MTATAVAVERELLSRNDVLVTNARFIVNGQTFAMSGVTSVRMGVRVPSLKWPLILIVLGVSAVFLNGFKADSVTFGLFLIAAGVAWWILNKPVFSVVLTSASGETETLSSKDREFVTSVIAAINEAIVHRG